MGEPSSHLFPHQDFELSSADYDQLESKFALLDRLAEVENSSIAVLDLNQGKFVYNRCKFADKMGFDLNKASLLGPPYFTSLIHPDDLHVIKDTNKQIFEFVSSLPIDERKDYKVIENCRVRNAHDKYITFIMQIIPIELDRKGNIWLLMMLHDILSDTKFDKVNRRLINIRTGKNYLFYKDVESNKSILSSREIEVLGLASKGFVSKEIADKLSISVNTVNNHRQKILEKINATNTAEAVSYARNLGLI